MVDGCFSKLRRHLCLPQTEVTVESHFLGLLLRDCTTRMPFDNHGLVCLVDPTPCVIYPISATDIRALISFPRALPPRDELKQWLTDELAPQLPASLRPALAAAVAEGAFRSMPNQFMAVRACFFSKKNTKKQPHAAPTYP